jgi:hypothetical protein
MLNYLSLRQQNPTNHKSKNIVLCLPSKSHRRRCLPGDTSWTRAARNGTPRCIHSLRSFAFWTTRRNSSAHISLPMGTTRGGPKRRTSGSSSLRTEPRIARTRSSAWNRHRQKPSNTTSRAEVPTYLRDLVWPQFWSSGMLHCVAGWVLHSTNPRIWKRYVLSKRRYMLNFLPHDVASQKSRIIVEIPFQAHPSFIRHYQRFISY